MATVHPAGITFTIETPFDLEDTTAYFTRIKGELFCYASEEDETTVYAGFLELYIIDIFGAQSHDHDLFELFDQTQESFECYELLFDPETDELNEPFLDQFEDATGANILLLHRLEVLPAFRSHKLGLRAINRALDLFGNGCGYAVLKAMPLQFEAHDAAERAQWYTEMQLAGFASNEAASRSRLQAHYALLGFCAVAGTPWMALNLDNERPEVEMVRG